MLKKYPSISCLMIGPARFVMRQRALLKSQQHKKANPRVSPPHPHNSLPQREGIIPILIEATIYVASIRIGNVSGTIFIDNPM
jgi:hypothetical protein